jgi:putative restriction endonuclease
MFTTDEYIRGLQILLPKLSEYQKQMLQTHYSAPNHIITPAQMARSLGWSHFVVANGQYGKLGRKIAKAIEKEIRPFFNGEVYPVLVMADFQGSEPLTWVMWKEFVIALEQVGIVNPDQLSRFPDEFSNDEVFLEGTVYSVQVNLYERSPFAREACIRHYGATCQICNFNFSNFYGELMDNFIHVHHLKPLSEINETYKVHPIRDLIPICPNCHAVIHSRRPAFSPEEVRSMLQGVSR